MASSIDKDWIEWAQTDWLELLRYVSRTYGAIAVNDLKDEFAKQMGIGANAIDILTNIAVGKVAGVVSAPLSMTMDVLDLFTKVAGMIYYNTQLNPRTRKNPHNMWKQGLFSSTWNYDKASLPDYVKFLLYCYPKDREAGYAGFRYGPEQPKPGQMPPPAAALPKKKN